MTYRRAAERGGIGRTVGEDNKYLTFQNVRGKNVSYSK